MKYKRILAYIIDALIITMLLSVLTLAIPQNNKIEKYEKEFNDISKKYISQEISDNEYLIGYSKSLNNLDKANLSENIILLLITVGYTIVTPVLLKNQTVGQKVTKIKLIKKDGSSVTMIDWLIRSVIIYGTIYSLITIIIPHIFNGFAYLGMVSGLILVQIILMIVTAVGVLKRNVGIHDKLTNIQVEEVE